LSLPLCCSPSAKAEYIGTFTVGSSYSFRGVKVGFFDGHLLSPTRVSVQIGMEIAPKGVGLFFAEVGFDAAYVGGTIV
jgi:hypothetical protein